MRVTVTSPKIVSRRRVWRRLWVRRTGPAGLSSASAAPTSPCPRVSRCACRASRHTSRPRRSDSRSSSGRLACALAERARKASNSLKASSAVEGRRRVPTDEKYDTSRRAHPRRHEPALPRSKPPPSPPWIEHLTALQARDIQPNERYPRVYRPPEPPRQPRNSTPTRVSASSQSRHTLLNSSYIPEEES